MPLFSNPFRARWDAMSVQSKAVLLVSTGSMTLVAMANIVIAAKALSSRTATPKRIDCLATSVIGHARFVQECIDLRLKVEMPCLPG